MIQIQSRHGDEGTSVIEMVVVTALLLFVMAIVLPALAGAQRTQQFSQERSEAMEELRFTANVFAKDVRAARQVLAGSNDSRLRLDVGTSEAAEVIEYSLAEKDGLWDLRRSDASGARTFVVNVPSAVGIFGYRNGSGVEAQSQAAVAVVLSLSTRPNERFGVVELETEVTLRNV